jgi:hypothetical protein
MKQYLTSGLQKLIPITKPPTAAKQFRKGLQSEAYVGIAGRAQWKRAALSGDLGLSLASWGMDALPAISSEADVRTHSTK